VKVGAFGLAIALLVLPGCSGDEPAGPTTEELDQRRQALVSSLQKKKAARHTATQADESKPEGFAATGADFSYDPKGKRDPFRSFEWEQMKRELLNQEDGGPLEQFDLAQLSLVGVIWDVGTARALIQDPSGMSYVVGEGARVGKNEGRVTRIDDNTVVVRERYTDFAGKVSTKSVEMHMRSSDGG
jgi:Tfp pilus assembly protein PilP